VENLTAIQSDWATIRDDLNRTQGRRDAILARVNETQTTIFDLEAESEVLERVGDLFRVLIDKEVIDNARNAQDLLTEGLRAIFDDLDLSVRSEVEVKRGRVSVDLLTVQKEPDGTFTEGSSIDAYGGSVSTVESVLLRIVVLFRRGLRPLLLLDESLGAVAEHYVPRVGRFLSLLADRMDLDILAVTHSPVLVEAANKAYRINKKEGVATFGEIRT